MNYKKIYNDFIDYCKSTTIEERLLKRNKYDERFKFDKIYAEVHHILPKALGGKNDKNNLVKLLPEEHLFAHQVRWYAYKNRVDMLAVRYTLNGIVGEKCNDISKIKNHPRITKLIRSTFAWMKQNSYEVRMTHGWQTEDGLKRISEARKGKMPVKDVKTNKMIGSVSTNHPKVLSGEWVHHTRGTILSEEERLKKGGPGEKNSRYSGITDEKIVEIASEYSKSIGRIPGMSPIREYALNKYNIKIPKFFSKFRFKENKWYKYVEEKTGLKYNPYYKSEEMKRKISETLKNKGK